MNLAFPALFAFLLVLPGILLRFSYLRGSWGANSPYVVSSITDEVAYGLFFAILLHLVWASIVSLVIHCFGLQIDLDSVLMLLLGIFGKDSARFETAINSATKYPYHICGYFIGLLTISWLLGGRMHRLVRRKKLDLKYPWLRFRNDWYYLISGETLEIDQRPPQRFSISELKRLWSDLRSDPPQPARNIGGVYLSAVVKQGNDSYLYRGIVADYFFDRSGNLDRVLLTLAHRRRLSEDRQPGQSHDLHSAIDNERYYDIVGDYFVLRYADMQTVNIEYFGLPTSSGISDSSQPPDPTAATTGITDQAVATQRSPLDTQQGSSPDDAGGRLRTATALGRASFALAGLILWRAKMGRKKRAERTK